MALDVSWHAPGRRISLRTLQHLMSERGDITMTGVELSITVPRGTSSAIRGAMLLRK
jgi:hypothetical protein